MKNTSVKIVDLSIIIVTHNRAQRLVQCIHTILKCRTLPKEIIVVDDGDLKSDVHGQLASYIAQCVTRILYVRVSKPRGVSFSRNLGIRRATGKIIGFVDDDCNVAEDWVSQVLSSFHANPQCMAITGKILPMFPRNYWNQVLSVFHADRPDVKRRTHFLAGANYFFRSEVFTKHTIRFNDEMSLCSEDRYISHMLDVHKLSMLYDPSIVVWHDFRTNMIAISKQWFRYGMSDYYFWKLTPAYQNKDAHYFRHRLNVAKLCQTFVRVPVRIYQILVDLKPGISQASLIPGLAFIFCVYYAGIYSVYIAENLRLSQ